MQFEPDIAEPSNDEAVVEEAAAEIVDNEEQVEVVDAQETSEGGSEVTLVDAAEDSGPGVDELEDRLRDLQGAMDKIQAGDLDAAERAIETLEQRMETTRD